MSKSFKDISIEEYLKRLGSGDPTPGGGAAAALTSAQGAALIMMVANHTIGKPKYAEFEELNKDILSEAEVLLGSLTDGIDNDAEAFGKVSAAYALPRQFSDIQIDRVSAEIKRLKAEGHAIDDIYEEGMTAEIMDQIENALKADRQDAIASVSVNNNGSSRLDIGSLSGIKKLETFSGGSSYDITLSLSTKSGNVRLVLCTKDAILHEFSPNGDDQTYHLEKQNKTVYLKIAGEEAAFKLEYKTEKKS